MNYLVAGGLLFIVSVIGACLGAAAAGFVRRFESRFVPVCTMSAIAFFLCCWLIVVVLFGKEPDKQVLYVAGGCLVFAPLAGLIGFGVGKVIQRVRGL
jgi:uncharacterized membrane protein